LTKLGVNSWWLPRYLGGKFFGKARLKLGCSADYDDNDDDIPYNNINQQLLERSNQPIFLA
jgi:hypothetical protein